MGKVTQKVCLSKTFAVKCFNYKCHTIISKSLVARCAEAERLLLPPPYGSRWVLVALDDGYSHLLKKTL